MSAFDLTIRHGRIITATDDFQGDIGIVDGRIAAVAERLSPGRRDYDAAGRLVMPGGIDSHCHVEQLSSMGVLCADDWYSASVSAAYGGNTCIVPFAAQHRGQSLREVAEQYRASAAAKSVIDFSYHLIVSDPTPQTLETDLPSLIREGITSFKVFMTYERLKLDDAQLLEVFAIAAREGALPMVHAENNDVITWVARHLLRHGLTAPKYHATSHAPVAETEATNRAIQLASLLDVPVMIVHVSTQGAAQAIHAARTLGAPVHGETCPHYLLLTADDLDLPGVEGAKFCCSPPPRDPASQAALWRALAGGTLQLFSSDHAPYRFDETGKLPSGEATTFKQIANGLPGLEVRMPLLFSEGVRKGRITLNQFVALTSTNHALMYGMHPRKGTIAPGADADIVVWDPARERRITWADLHDAVGYTPYEGMTITGWPDVVFSRGEAVVEAGTLQAAAGRGRFVSRGQPAPVRSARVPGTEARFMRSLSGAGPFTAR
ncbi:dihydropyrimidinase [Verticiella sediminum]|uniref:D-hydantoinase n=1 Tax=Verticiella sediminum TaxID=1247510 RepID=A0A556AGX6_9BURK|nr:dihydropyrimidinase [Verticiella sediminum]TSH92135.1 dihydropyrimidinase [Verticiella sediminum]